MKRDINGKPKIDYKAPELKEQIDKVLGRLEVVTNDLVKALEGLKAEPNPKISDEKLPNDFIEPYDETRPKTICGKGKEE